MIRLAIIAAMAAVAFPAASGQYLKIDDIPGESKAARCEDGRAPTSPSTASAGGGGAGKVKMAADGDGTAIQGALDRDIIRRVPRRPSTSQATPEPQAASSGGVRVAVGDVTGDGHDHAAGKVGSFAVKQKAADCMGDAATTPPVKRKPTVRQ
jgi:hypothetical protein